MQPKIYYNYITQKYTFTSKSGKISSSTRKSYILKEFEKDTGTVLTKADQDNIIKSTPLNPLFTINWIN